MAMGPWDLIWRIASFHGRPVHPDAWTVFDALIESQQEALIAVIEAARTVEDYLDLQRENDDKIHEDDGDADDDYE